MQPQPYPLLPAQQFDDNAVLETSQITRDRDPDTGRVMVNQYVILDELGKGSQGQVRRARDTETGVIWAVKIVKRWNRKRLPLLRGNGIVDTPPLSGLMDEKIRREIAILKKCNHHNVVRLREVIDDGASKTIFLVLEYMAGGEIIWRDPESAEPEPAMTVDQCRQTLRDVVLGLEYLHHQGIIHRDIKPANLLCTADRQTVKITDFGVSYLSTRPQADSIDMETISNSKTTEELKKTAGSPAFYAPELCHPGDVTFTSFSSLSDVPGPKPILTKAIDIWALGVTLYCLLFGKAPYTAETEYVLWSVIMRTDYVLPDYMGADRISTVAGEEAMEIQNLLSRLMEKDPAKRITLTEVKRHPWLLRNLPSASTWIQMNDISEQVPVTVSFEEVASAVAIKDKLKRKFERFVQVIGRRGSSSQINSPVDTTTSPSGQSIHSPRSPIFALLQADSRGSSRPPSPSNVLAQNFSSQQRYSSAPAKSFSMDESKSSLKQSKDVKRNSLKKMIASLRGKRSDPTLIFSPPAPSTSSNSDDSWNMISLTESLKNVAAENALLRRATSSSGLQVSSPLANASHDISDSDDEVMRQPKETQNGKSKFLEEDDYSSVEEEQFRSTVRNMPYVLPSELPGISAGLGLTLPKDKSFASGLMTLTRSISSTAVNERPRFTAESPRRKSYEPSSALRHNKSPSEELGVYDDAETPELEYPRDRLKIPLRRN